MATISPTLYYVGSVDTTTSSNGVNMFRILFDASISNVLMFEYQILQNTTSLIPPEDIITGFINPDTAQSEGIVNQWLVPIPSTGTNYDTGLVVRVRVYPAQGLAVTPWSNSLNFYNPPPAPVILYAKYDANTPLYYENNDDLWVMLEGDELPGIQYILAYYFCDSDNNTIWKVSEPIIPEVVVYESQNRLVVHTSMYDDVSTAIDKSVVYVAAHAVFPFQYNQDIFYTVSEISATEPAEQAEFEAPILKDISYNNTNQQVTLTWKAPNSSFLPFYRVSDYNVYLTTTNGTSVTTILLANIPGTLNTYSYTNNVTACGTQLSYYVVANSATGAPSLTSNTQSILVFYAATAPLNLKYDWAVPTNPSSSTVVVGFTFKNPTSLGCGSAPEMNWQIVNRSPTGEIIVTSGILPYVAGTSIYYKIVEFNYISTNEYVIRTFVSTIDTNSTARLNGAVSQSSAIVPEEIPIIYDIVPNSNYVEFNVASKGLISPTAQLIYVTQFGTIVTVNHKPFNTSIFEPRQEGDVEVYYSCIVYWSDLGIPQPDHFTIAVSNSAGVGIGRYNQPSPPL